MRRHRTRDFELDTYFDPDHLPRDDDELRVMALLTDVRGVYAVGPPPAPRADLAALFLADTTHSNVVSITSVPGARQERTSRARRRVLTLIAAALLAVFATTGLAAARTLPEPIRRIVSSMLSPAGIAIPAASSSHPDPSSTRNAGTRGSGPLGSAHGGSQAPTSLGSPTVTSPSVTGGISTTTPITTTSLPPATVPPVTVPPVLLPPWSINLPLLGS